MKLFGWLITAVAALVIVWGGFDAYNAAKDLADTLSVDSPDTGQPLALIGIGFAILGRAIVGIAESSETGLFGPADQF